MRIRSLAVAAVVCALVLPMAACGSDESTGSGEPNGIVDQSAITAFQRGAQATLAATDVVASGALPVDGVQSTVEQKFSGGSGEATVTSKAAKYQVIRVGQNIYVRGDKAFWTELVGSEQATKINDRWAQSLVDGPLAQFNFFVDRNSYFRGSGNITTGDVTTVNGQETLPIIDPKTNTDSTWWLSTKGEPVLSKYKSGKDTNFDLRYDDVVVIEAPPAASVIDIGSIKVPTTKATPAPTKK